VKTKGKKMEVKSLPNELRDGAKYLARVMAPLLPDGRVTEEVRLMREAADEIERLSAQQAETDCANWWPTVERFLQAAGIKPSSWHETVPEQIERGIKRVEEMRKFKFPNEVVLFCENIKATEAAKKKQ